MKSFQSFNMAVRGWLYLLGFVFLISVCYGKKKVTKEVWRISKEVYLNFSSFL